MTIKFAGLKWEGMNQVGAGEAVPMAKKLKPNQYILLSAIALYQGEGGHCDTTHLQLAGAVPYGRKVIGTTMESLLDFKYEGKPVIERIEIQGVKGQTQYIYKLLPNPLFAVYGEELTWVNMTHEESGTCVNMTHSNKQVNISNTSNTSTKEETRMNKKERILYFKDLLVDKGIQPDFKFPAMYSKMKRSGVDEILTELTEEQLKEVLEFIAREYGNGKIKSDVIKYPLDMQVITRKWVVERAVQLVTQSEKVSKEEESRLEERAVVSNERQEKAIKSIMDRIRKGKSE